MRVYMHACLAAYMYMHTYIHTCADLSSLPNGVISVRVGPLRCWPWYSHHCDLTKLLTLQNAACLPGLLSLLHTVHGVEEHTVNTQPWKLKASVGLQLLAFLGPEQLSSCFPPFPSLSLSLLLPVSLCKHTCVVLYVCVYLHMWRSEDNLGCHASGAIHRFVSLIQDLSGLELTR